MYRIQTFLDFYIFFIFTKPLSEANIKSTQMAYHCRPNQSLVHVRAGPEEGEQEDYDDDDDETLC